MHFKIKCRLQNGHFFHNAINSLWPSGGIWWHTSGPTLAQVMACSLTVTAPSHYLNQCRLLNNEVQWHSTEGNFTNDTWATNHSKYLKNYLSWIELNLNLSVANELTMSFSDHLQQRSSWSDPGVEVYSVLHGNCAYDEGVPFWTGKMCSCYDTGANNVLMLCMTLV